MHVFPAVVKLMGSVAVTANFLLHFETLWLETFIDLVTASKKFLRAACPSLGAICLEGKTSFHKLQQRVPMPRNGQKPAKWEIVAFLPSLWKCLMETCETVFHHLWVEQLINHLLH